MALCGLGKASRHRIVVLAERSELRRVQLAPADHPSNSLEARAPGVGFILGYPAIALILFCAYAIIWSGILASGVMT